jgi:transposase-like protein
MAVVIGGKQFWFWRTVDSEGEVLDPLVQRRRKKAAAAKAHAWTAEEAGLPA